MTTNQRALIFALFNQIKDRDPEYLHGWAVGYFRVKSLNDLTNSEIDWLIRLLQQKGAKQDNPQTTP